MITIDGKEYKEEDFTPSAKIQLQRAQALREELTQTEMRAAELNVLIDAYVTAIRKSLEVVEEAREEMSEGDEAAA